MLKSEVSLLFDRFDGSFCSAASFQCFDLVVSLVGWLLGWLVGCFVGSLVSWLICL